MAVMAHTTDMHPGRLRRVPGSPRGARLGGASCPWVRPWVRPWVHPWEAASSPRPSCLHSQHKRSKDSCRVACMVVGAPRVVLPHRRRGWRGPAQGWHVPNPAPAQDATHPWAGASCRPSCLQQAPRGGKGVMLHRCGGPQMGGKVAPKHANPRRLHAALGPAWQITWTHAAHAAHRHAHARHAHAHAHARSHLL